MVNGRELETEAEGFLFNSCFYQLLQDMLKKCGNLLKYMYKKCGNKESNRIKKCGKEKENV